VVTPKPRREQARSEGVFSDFEVEDYLENRPLIQALAVSEEIARVTIARLTHEHSVTRRELEKAQRALSDFRISHEQDAGDQRTSIARLEESLAASRHRIEEQSRQSTVAIIVAWAGTVLVGFGVNLVTGGDQKPLGMGLLGLGALVEGVAFFIPRRTERRAVGTST
jgi:hypothetical protein